MDGNGIPDDCQLSQHTMAALFGTFAFHLRSTSAMNHPCPSSRLSGKDPLTLIISVLKQIHTEITSFRRKNSKLRIARVKLLRNQDPTTMIYRHLRLSLAAAITAVFALVIGPDAQAQLHDVLVEPSNAVYSSTVEISDGTEHMLIASTVDDAGSNPEVRISRVKTDGSIEWESDYQSTNGWRASHVLTVGDDTGVLIGVVGGGTGGGPASSMLMSFDLTTGNTIGTAEIQEAGANANKGLVLTHGIHANGLLVLTGWLGGYTGLQLDEDRVSVLLGVEVPDGNQSSLNPNWIHALNTNGPIDGPDYDMGSHVVEVSPIGYLMSGSANAFAQNPGSSGYHQAPLASLVDYDGTEIWSKVTPYWFPGEGVDNQPIVPIANRHAVASCATPLYASAANSNNIELVQTVNWVHNRGLTTLRYSIDGTSIEAKGLRLDGTFNFPSAETSLKGYSMYRALNANSATEVMIAGYVNDPEYLDSDPSTDPKDRVPFLMRVDIEGTSTTTYLVDHNIYAGSPSTNYGDDPGIHAGNSQSGQQPIIYHPEMMDLRESALGYGLIGHRRTHDVPAVFDPSIIHVNSAGADAFSALFGCEDFTHPMAFEFPAVDPFTPFQETINLIGFPQDVSVHLPSTFPTPCDEYFSCDVVLDVAVTTDTCDHYILTASNLGSTPMSELQLSFDRGLDGTVEQSGKADGSDGSGNPSYADVYPSGVATSIEVTLNCQGVDYSQVVTLTPDCPDDDDDEEDCELDIAPGIDMWLYCGEGCWGGTTGTRAAITFDMALFSLNESEYDAEVCFSDGTTYPLNLDAPMSLIKCFSGFTFFKRACLKIYEEGGMAAGAEPCYEVCDSESCISIERLPLDLADALIPDLAFNASTCSLEAPELPTSIDSRTQIMTFNSVFPGGDDGLASLAAFMNGDDFAELAEDHTVGSTAGDYTATCNYTLQTDITHPILYSTAGANAAEELQTNANLEGPNTILVAGTPSVELVSGYIDGAGATSSWDGLIGEMILYNQYDPVPVGLETSFTDLIPINQNISGIGYNIWNPSSFSYCLDSWCYNGSLPEESDNENGSSTSEEEDCGGVPDVPTGTHYDNGVLGSASFSLSDNTSISVAEAGQICPQNFTYLTEVTLSVFNTTELFEEEEEEEFPMGEWTPNDENEEEEFPMGEWTPTTFVGTSILTDVVLQPYESGATVQDLAIDYYDGFGDGSGPWSVTDTEGNIVASGEMPNGESIGEAASSSATISLPPGNYEFMWDVDCYGAYDNSGIQVSDGYTPILELTPGGNTPGIIRIPFDVPGIIIVPTPTPADTTCDAAFTHDLMPLGALPSSAPGVTIASENGIDLSLEAFYDGYGMTYGFAAVDMALPTVGFDQVLVTSNINAVYDLSIFPNVNEVSFVFFDGAGIENLKVNGHTLLTGELEAMPAGVAPGVSMAVTTTTHPGYQSGTVVLTGNVQKLEIGGQQFYVDHICVKHDGDITQDPNPDPNAGGCDATCDVFTDFDALIAGERYGDLVKGATTEVLPGGLAVVSDGVPIYLEPLHDFGATHYNYMAVDAHFAGFGSGNSLWTNNITAQFDIQAVMDVTDTVCIAFRDDGGFENIWINGATPARGPNGYGGLTVFDGAILGGVLVEVTGAMVGSYAFEGTITLIGDVDKFSIGGQELWVDDLCISGADDVASLDEFLEAEGEEGLLAMLNPQVEVDTANCALAVSLDVSNTDLPSADALELVLVGTESGTVYSTLSFSEGGDFVPTESGLSIAMMPHIITWDGLLLASIPETNGEMLAVLISVSEGSSLVELQVPDVVVPDCGGGTIDIPCIALADFVWLDNGDCTFNAVFTGTPGVIEWTVDGIPQISSAAVLSGSLDSGTHDVCVTVTDFNDPSCTHTSCQVVSISCSNNATDECDMEFTHELMAAGDVAAPGAGVTVASEDDIDLSLDNIQYISGASNFGTATVQAAQPEAGDGQVLWLNNIMAVYDVSAAGPVQQVSFDFIDYGGLENLRINGLLLVDGIDDMHGANLGGVTVAVAYNTYSGFIAGEVILTGNVQELGVAGQELYIDNVCVIAGDANGGDCDLECDYTTDFDSDYSGNSWGDPAAGASVNVTPGNYAFTSGDVDVYAEVFQPYIGGSAFGSPTYNKMTTETAGVFGLGRILQLSNISARFDIESAVSETDTVCVTFKVEGNNAKVGINNTEYTSEDLDYFLSLDGMGIGGPSGTTVGTIQITGTPDLTANGTLVAYTYVMTLIGDVHTLSFGGDEVRVDDVCIVAEGATACVDTDADGICDDDEVAGCTDPTAANYNPNATDDDGSCSVPGQNDACDMEFTHELMAAGDVAAAGAGMTVASEDDIDLSLDNIQYISGASNFGTATVQAAQPEAGDGQVLWLNNIMAVYDVSAAGPVQQVSFDFIDYGGLENLRINGLLLVDGIDDMHGANLGGVTVAVAYNTYSGFIAGEVILTGNVQELGVAGQELYIDNVCVIAGDANGGDCDLECDYTTDFDSDYSGNSWGDPAAGASVAVAEYDFAFTSGDIDVYAIPTLHASIAACGDPLYQYMTTETAGTFGVGRVLRLNNIGAQFDIQSAVPETDTVCVAYRYAGNLRGFTLNGTTLCNNNPSMSSLHNMVFGGCLMQVDEVLETTANGSVVAASGVLTIIGDVNNIEFRGDEVWVDDLCISVTEGPSNLTDFIEDEGAEVLLAMMNPQIEYDTEGCSLAASLDLSDANLPTADVMELQLIGSETGTVYSTASFVQGDADDGGIAEMPGGDASATSRMPHIVTWDGLLLTDIPETNGEMLLVSIALTEGNTFIALGVDGVLVPGCNDAPTQGCTYPEAENYNPDADEDDGSCVILGSNPCPTDIDGDGLTSVPDLLLLLGSFSLECTGGEE